MVNLYINDERIDLEGKETIAGNYAIAPFSDISKRTAFQTISFNVPKTGNNKRILENAQVVVNDSTLPYSYLKARLDVDGIDQQITSAELVSVADTFKLKLFGGNIDFFSYIKDRTLNDLDLSDLDHDFDITDIVASFTNTGGYIYPIIDFHSDSPNTAMPESTADVDVRWLFPAVYSHTIIERIVADAGFTLEGEILTDENYLSLIVQFTTKLIGEYGAQLLSTGETTTTENLSFVGVNIYLNWVDTYDPLNLLASATYSVNYDGVVVPAQTLVRYLVYITGRYKFSINFDYSNNSNVINNRVWLVRQTSGGAFNLITEQLMTGASGTITYESDLIDCDEDDVIHVLFPDVAFNSDTVDIASGATFDVLETDVEETSYGKVYDVAANMPNMKQSDFLKYIAQAFGLMIFANPITKVVQLVKFSEIVDNKPNALDWTEKVDYSQDAEINFKDTSYGQSNSCTYQDDETVVKPTGTDYELLISNTTLKPTNELFEAPFAASESVTRLNGYQLNQIKVYTDAGGADEEIAEVEPRILIIRTAQFSPALELNEGGATVDTATSAPLTHFIEIDQTFNLGWSNNLITSYSQEIVDTISRYKIITLLLRLTAIDINQLDFTLPVWIELNNDSGAYYFISSIKQFKFTSRESTEVELIKLP